MQYLQLEAAATTNWTTAALPFTAGYSPSSAVVDGLLYVVTYDVSDGCCPAPHYLLVSLGGNPKGPFSLYGAQPSALWSGGILSTRLQKESYGVCVLCMYPSACRWEGLATACAIHVRS